MSQEWLEELPPLLCGLGRGERAVGAVPFARPGSLPVRQEVEGGPVEAEAGAGTGAGAASGGGAARRHRNR